jgi:type VI protein secretion system component VasK
VFFSIALLALPSVSLADQTAEEKTTKKEVKQEIKEAFEAVKNYTADQRDEAVKNIKVALENIDDQIESMENRIGNKWDQMDQVARRKARSTLASLRKQRNELAEWYGGLKYSSAEAWGHVKNGFLKSYEALSQAFGQAESELNSNGSAKDSN